MTTPEFTPGQRWISNTEPDLGLGTLTRREGRTITLLFLATDEMRTYARDNAPLTRVQFLPGDQIESHEGWLLQVTDVVDQAGLLTYRGTTPEGEKRELPEGELSNFIQFSRPQERLFAGQIDNNAWFDLRYQTLTQRQRLEQSELAGLGGVRTELLSHQLYIAHEVGQRLAPRVLLADEVGLGKTIEACLILHRQLLTGRAARALIIVPNPLLHQWLVELMRRFNLRFSLFDEERCQAIESSGQGENPFLAEQLVLCGLELLTADPLRQQQALQGEWDILIVDEAHHLEWSEEAASPAYQVVEALANKIPGVLLLTATPEQLGRAGHFARLRLLDPDRFYSLDTFLEEETLYQPVAEAVAQLLAGEGVSEAASRELLDSMNDPDAAPLITRINNKEEPAASQHEAQEQLIQLLLDRHGTGRVLFRNSRDRIEGFAERELHKHPLPLPDGYLDRAVRDNSDPLQLLHPESLFPTLDGNPWWQTDPRLSWLTNLLKELDGEKVLLICAQRETALGIEEALRTRQGIHAGLFHEEMSIIERDRAAAWFADMEQGCRLMICSEIGSEGRNFQFAHHLVLFDLPTNPDLLEQRIGRLDRIGQRECVRIHVPYFQQSAQEVMLRWYHEGLNAFCHTCPAGPQILRRLRPALLQAMEEGENEADALELLIKSTKELHEDLTNKLKHGRDQLLELNSCRPKEAEKLRESIAWEDADPTLADYMAAVWNSYGVEVEHHSAGSQILKPSARMQLEHFPELPVEGVTVTFNRTIALGYEERQYLTWEHPMVRECMEMTINNERGNSCAIAVHHPDIGAGTLMLELLFVLECPAPRLLQAGRFLPPTLLHVLVDQNLQDRSDSISHRDLNETLQKLPKNSARKIITPLRGRLRSMLEKAEAVAETIRPEAIDSALQGMRLRYRTEIERLTALQRINPSVRDDEIELLQEHQQALEEHLLATRVRLDALRMVVAV
ncbi:MAG: RNA polymerase-associated protein RapA [Sedimenticola sp.]